jgi:hypothetical protein
MHALALLPVFVSMKMPAELSAALSLQAMK